MSFTNKVIALSWYPLLWGYFLLEMYKQQQYTRRVIGREMNSVGIRPDVLPIEVRKKIFKYYGTAVPALVGAFLSQLRHQQLHADERYILTLFGAATGLFDDLFDNGKYSDHEILEILQRPENIITENPETHLFIHLYTKALEKVSAPSTVKAACLEVYSAQRNSRKQKNGRLSQEELLNITAQKGAASLQLYGCLLNHGTTPQLLSILSKTGIVGQMENDIFDVWEDTSAGIQTLANSTSDLTVLRQRYLQAIDDVLLAMDTADIKSSMAARLFIMIAARGLVCIDFYQKATMSNNGKFVPASLQRIQMICDMDTLVAQWQSLQHYLGLCGSKHVHLDPHN